MKFRIRSISVCLARFFRHFNSTKRHKRPFQRLIGLKTNDLLQILCFFTDISRSMRGKRWYDIRVHIQHAALCTFFFLKLLQDSPQLICCFRRFCQKAWITVIWFIIFLDEISGIDFFFPNLPLKSIPFFKVYHSFSLSRTGLCIQSRKAYRSASSASQTCRAIKQTPVIVIGSLSVWGLTRGLLYETKADFVNMNRVFLFIQIAWEIIPFMMTAWKLYRQFFLAQISKFNNRTIVAGIVEDILIWFYFNTDRGGNHAKYIFIIRIITCKMLSGYIITTILLIKFFQYLQFIFILFLVSHRKRILQSTIQCTIIRMATQVPIPTGMQIS